jgi:hypothetical protein
MITMWLELDYEGTDPPIDLFADLAMIGWRPPAPAAPPASAIDWSRTDLAEGERFKVLPWRVTGAVVEPPAGTGTRGHWTRAERTAFLLPLEGVLRRHGLDAEGLPGTGPDRPAPPDAAAPAPPSPAAAAPAPPPPAAPTPLAQAPGPPAAPAEAATGGATVVVKAAVSPASRRDAVAEALAPLHVPFHLAEVERTITNTYRGSTFETTTLVLEVQALVAERLAPLVARVLRDCGLKPDVGPPAPEPLAAPTRERGSADDDVERDDLPAPPLPG